VLIVWLGERLFPWDPAHVHRTQIDFWLNSLTPRP